MVTDIKINLFMSLSFPNWELASLYLDNCDNKCGFWLGPPQTTFYRCGRIAESRDLLFSTRWFASKFLKVEHTDRIDMMKIE